MDIFQARFLLAAVGLVALFQLQGCGGGDSTTPSPGGTTTPSPPAPTPTPATPTPELVKEPVTIITYNLFWWCVMGGDKSGRCTGNLDGKGLQGLSSTIHKHLPGDMIGFQECQGIEKIIDGMGLRDSHSYACAPKQNQYVGTDACMAWNNTRFELLGKAQSAVVGSDQWGNRYAQWVRLKIRGTTATITFMNTHGPLTSCNGEGAKVLAKTTLDTIKGAMQPGDAFFYVGDFNCFDNQDVMRKIYESYNLVITSDVQQPGQDTAGMDHIISDFISHKISAESVDGRPSDHSLLKATYQVMDYKGADPSTITTPTTTPGPPWAPCSGTSKQCCNPTADPPQMCGASGSVECHKCGGGDNCECPQTQQVFDTPVVL